MGLIITRGFGVSASGVYPLELNVKEGVSYGKDGTEFTGTLLWPVSMILSGAISEDSVGITLAEDSIISDVVADDIDSAIELETLDEIIVSDNVSGDIKD